MIKIIKLTLSPVCIFLLFLCISSDKNIFGTPRIKTGRAKIIGKIIPPDTKRDSIYVDILISNPISGEDVKHTVLADQSGKFSVAVDVETDISLISLSTSLTYSPIYVKLGSSGISNIDIIYKQDSDIESVKVTPNGLTSNDMAKSIEVISKMFDHSSGRKPEPLYSKSPDYFLRYAKTILAERLEILKDNELLTREMKQILAKNFSLSLYNTFVFDYERYMVSNFNAVANNKNIRPAFQKIDRSYYRFLKDFKLNDPQYLICSEFPKLQQAILENQIIGLPSIGDTDISSWLAKVKTILSDLVGFDDGPYYDNLAANAYGRQLSVELKPLSIKQQTNISKYWKKGEITKILFRKNRQIIEMEKFKSPAIMNDISTVPKEKVIEAILNKYKNKVILIDLWATWCAPCIVAMQQFRSEKAKFHDKDAVFVYITNGSSPPKLWEEKIKGIGDEHYYLTEDQWNYVMAQFKLNSIPSYLLFNKQGIITKKFTGFPGNDEIKESIHILL
ncbi:TlpA family protein disulfide reductase [Pedobacter ureilyticus]|jgi:thiol-disulfide isomerase/thioredoxin|uniref:TlpA family protein disulfide reductase n=1 Tax=Pedobacter ureilyticus TaxID=1393051 RepID=A0ABW9JAY6_9SPHI|nr:TlpA disulfide reductase family protein [Pedobacter helvus]